MITVIKDSFILIRPSGFFDNRSLTLIRKEIMEIEAEKPYLTKRFSDFTDVTKLDISFADFDHYRNHRMYLEDETKYRTAFFVNSDIKFGYARMCQTIITNPKNEIRIFRCKQEAANWLEINWADIPD